MELEAGRRLGRYRLEEKIGEGGMGVVWRAVDTTLDREAALKMLPAGFSEDAERLARFRREAKILASLNHPAIAGVYGLEESGEDLFLAMELVSGAELAERIGERGMSAEEARRIAIQVARALETAHAAGVVHRDLKPANVVVTAEGNAKVLDFGIAKVVHGASGTTQLATAGLAETADGSILGTVGYLSPEQARGQAVDRRTDVWAFGCVLYEMLVGRRPFQAGTASDELAALLSNDPDWSLLPAETPAEVRWLLRRCLTRDLERRLQDIGEARIALEEPETLAAAPPALTGRGGSAPRTRWLAGLLAGAVMGALAMAWLGQRGGEEGAEITAPPLRKVELEAPGLETGFLMSPVISPDGSMIVYRANGSLFVRDRDRLVARRLAGTEAARTLFWSPDSRWIGFAADGRFWKIPSAGGERVAICALSDMVAGGAGAVWTADDRIIYSSGSTTGLRQVAAAGGEPRSYAPADQAAGEQDYHHPFLLPDESGVVAVLHRQRGTVDGIVAIDESGSELLYEGAGETFDRPLIAPSGHLLFGRVYEATGIWAVPFSADERRVEGEPFLVAHEGRYASVSRDGTLVYVRHPNAGRRQLLRVDRQGDLVRAVGEPRWAMRTPRLSPDGTRVAVMARETGQTDLFVLDLQTESGNRLTLDEDIDQRPQWTPDGRRLVFGSAALGQPPRIASIAATGGERMEGQAGGASAAISPDGRHVVFVRDEGGPEVSSDLWYVPTDDLAGEPKLLLRAPGRQVRPQFSPDGRFVAFESNEADAVHVFVTRFPEGGERWQVSRTSGSFPRWGATSGEIYFIQGNSLWSVPAETEPALSLGPPRHLFDADPLSVDLAVGYDTAADGSGFVVLQNVDSGDPDRGLIVVENWTAEFAERR